MWALGPLFESQPINLFSLLFFYVVSIFERSREGHPVICQGFTIQGCSAGLFTRSTSTLSPSSRACKIRDLGRNH
ncbi:hypothetical protein BDN67DRAFT_628531 [Paxillus ammoniavirescens]|nr:hypothetical protein BDN67DRAFT_628531 [Paxillus ammoniavirescens]